ncbi:MAG: hypothetical protein AAGJ18_08450 [Bacteroidota bacterium]
MQKDTLFGKISMDVGKLPITFIHHKRKFNYHPSTIQSFGIFAEKGYKIYETLKSKEGHSIFVEVMVQGKLNLYKYTEKRNLKESIRYRYVYFFGFSKDALSIMSSSSYQRILGEFFRAYPDVLSELKRTTFENVPSLMEYYNAM